MNTSPNESNNNNEEEPIFVMTLELENGKAEHIKIYADSDPNELAYAFCKDHDLDFSALEYLKVRINDLLQQYKESGDENQIEEVDDEHEGTEDNKNFVYQTNENDSLRYSGEKEENKEGNSNEQVEITDNNNQSEENNLDEDNHQEEEYEEEEENEENKEEEEKISLKEESNSLKERPMNEEEGTLQDKEELLSEKIEHKEEEVNSNVIDNDKLRREEEIHQLTENNQIDDDIEVQDETPKEEDLHNEQEDELNEDNKPHVDPELEKEEEDIQKSEDITLEKRNDNPIEENYEKEEDYNKYVFEENQPKELEEDEDEYEEYNNKEPIHNDNTPIKEDTNALSINLPLKSNPKLQTENTDNTIAKQNTNSSPTAQISSAMQTKQNTDQHKIKPENKINTITETHKSVDSNELKQSEDDHPISRQSQSVNLNQCPSNYSQKQPNQSIFDRLFKDAEIKRVIPKRPCHFSNRSSLSRPSRSNTTHNNNISYESGYQNYGEYLYHKDIKSQKEKMKKNEEDKQRNYNNELCKCTFKPTLTEYNPSSINSNTANGSKNINTYSIPPSYRPHTSMSKAEKMQREFDEVYTFHPKINNNANYNVATSFYQRQQMHIQRQNANKIKNEQLLNNNNRFKMKRNYSSTNNQSAFDRNYNYANQYRQHKEELYNNINVNNPNMYPQPIKSSTNDIINSVMRDSFRNLFKELDSDEDNMISPLNINTKRTPSSIMKIIKPLLDELREDNHILDENDFIDAMTNLYNEINYYDRHLLINTYRTKKTMNYFNKPMVKTPTLYNNYEYKPKINNNATRLAKKYDRKIEKMFDSYMKTYSNNNSRYNGINRSQYFRCDPLKSNESNFTSITNCTFDNYLKNLN